MSAPVVACRRVIHPGRPQAPRVVTAAHAATRRVLLWLPEGMMLQTALVQAYARLGARAGTFELLGGQLAQAAYHVTGPRTDTPRVAEYGPATMIPGGALVVHGSGSYGDDLAGVPMVHIHAALADSAGRTHGGHVNPLLCVIGSGGVRAVLLPGAGFRQIEDAETQFTLFVPHAEAETWRMRL